MNSLDTLPPNLLFLKNFYHRPAKPVSKAADVSEEASLRMPKSYAIAYLISQTDAARSSAGFAASLHLCESAGVAQPGCPRCNWGGFGREALPPSEWSRA